MTRAPLKPLAIGFALSASLLLAAGAAGCSSNQEPAKAPSNRPPAACRDSPGDDVEMAAHTGWAGVKTGVKTGVEGARTGGRAVGGFVTHGSSGASSEWNAGKDDTRRVANDSAAEVRQEASVPVCPPN